MLNKDDLGKIEEEAGFITVEDQTIIDIASIYVSCNVFRCVMPNRVSESLGISHLKKSTSAVWFVSDDRNVMKSKLEELHEKNIKYAIFMPTKRFYKKNQPK
jgi:hypothetical protein